MQGDADWPRFSPDSAFIDMSTLLASAERPVTNPFAHGGAACSRYD